jgi:hypothetical protein
MYAGPPCSSKREAEMICVPGCGDAVARASLPERAGWTEPLQEIRNRQMAALHLQAATMTEDAAARRSLRRRAARLIWNGFGERGRSLAC